MFTGQNSEVWQCLSANACQLKKQFFENFTIWRKASLNKGFGEFSDLRYSKTSPYANWHIWASANTKKAIRDAYRFQTLYWWSVYKSLSIYSSSACFKWSKNKVREPARVFIRWNAWCTSVNDIRNKTCEIAVSFRMPNLPSEIAPDAYRAYISSIRAFLLSVQESSLMSSVFWKKVSGFSSGLILVKR